MILCFTVILRASQFIAVSASHPKILSLEKPSFLWVPAMYEQTGMSGMIWQDAVALRWKDHSLTGFGGPSCCNGPGFDAKVGRSTGGAPQVVHGMGDLQRACARTWRCELRKKCSCLWNEKVGPEFIAQGEIELRNFWRTKKVKQVWLQRLQVSLEKLDQKALQCELKYPPWLDGSDLTIKQFEPRNIQQS